MQGFEFDQFRNAQATGVEQFQHGLIAQAQAGVFVRRRQQCVYLVFGQGFGHTQSLFGRQHSESGIKLHNSLAQGPTVIALENR